MKEREGRIPASEPADPDKLAASDWKRHWVMPEDSPDTALMKISGVYTLIAFVCFLFRTLFKSQERLAFDGSKGEGAFPPPPPPGSGVEPKPEIRREFQTDSKKREEVKAPEKKPSLSLKKAFVLSQIFKRIDEG